MDDADAKEDNTFSDFTLARTKGLMGASTGASPARQRIGGGRGRGSGEDAACPRREEDGSGSPPSDGGDGEVLRGRGRAGEVGEVPVELGLRFKGFCASQGIRVDFPSVVHPQSNGQAERANGLILQGLKPRLLREVGRAAGAWVTELPSVLWGLRTTPNRSTGRSPFFLVYGEEAVLPSDLLHNAPRVELFSEAEAKQARQDGVDLLEEEREMALTRSTIYQQDLRRFHV